MNLLVLIGLILFFSILILLVFFIVARRRRIKRKDRLLRQEKAELRRLRIAGHNEPSAFVATSEKEAEAERQRQEAKTEAERQRQETKTEAERQRQEAKTEAKRQRQEAKTKAQRQSATSIYNTVKVGVTSKGQRITNGAADHMATIPDQGGILRSSHFKNPKANHMATIPDQGGILKSSHFKNPKADHMATIPDQGGILKSSHFYVDIGDSTRFLVIISDKTINMYSKDIEKLKIVVTMVVKEMTKHLDTATKKELVGEGSPNHKEYRLDIYNCHPNLKQKNEWTKDYEYLSDIKGWEFLGLSKTADGRSFGSGTFGLGGTRAIPRTSICIYDLVCGPFPKKGSYLSESVLVHEFAHTIMEVAIRKSHPEWYQEFLGISSSFNSGVGSSICPGAYHCNNRELFAGASQVWFNVTNRSTDDVTRFISTIDEMKLITIQGGSGKQSSLYDIMMKIYGSQRTLCNVLKSFPSCISKCKK